MIMINRPIVVEKFEGLIRDLRYKALEAAIVFRDCSARLRTSKPTSAVCRGLMRERALQWRRLAPPRIVRGKRA